MALIKNANAKETKSGKASISATTLLAPAAAADPAAATAELLPRNTCFALSLTSSSSK